jgi:hypothetical protein
MSSPTLRLLLVSLVYLGCSAPEPLAVPTGAAITLASAVPPSAVPASAAFDGGRPRAGACSDDRFPNTLPNPVQCCQDGNRTWHTTASGILVYRTYGPACREADGVGTNCGLGSDPFVPCAYGPCGTKNEWSIGAEEVWVFAPVSMPSKCGWEARGITRCTTTDADGCEWQKRGVRGFPEPYVDQPVYGGVAASCSYTHCLAGGRPAR